MLFLPADTKETGKLWRQSGYDRKLMVKSNKCGEIHNVIADCKGTNRQTIRDN